MNNNKIKSLTEMTNEDFKNDNSIARIVVKANKTPTSYGTTRYRLDLEFPCDYRISIDDSTSVRTKSGTRSRNAFELFNQDDYFTILLSKRLKPELLCVECYAFTRLLKGTYVKDGESITWWKLEVIIPLPNNKHICKSMFINQRRVDNLQLLVNNFQNYYEFEGKAPDVDVAEAVAVEE